MQANVRSLASQLAIAVGVALALAACISTAPSADDENDAGGGGSPVACETQAQCGAGQRCEGGLCVENKCTSSADCPGGFTCNLLHGECEEHAGGNPDGGGGGNTGTPDGGPNTGGGTGTTCSDKYTCPDGQICKSGKCANPAANNGCNADQDCPRGKICNFSKQCEAGCTDPKDCTAPELCHPQKFVCEKCSLTNPCPNVNGQPQQCVGGACQAAVACTSAQDCVNKGLDGAICTAAHFCGNCTAHGDCLVDPYKSEQPARVCGLDGLCKKVNCSDSQCQTALGPKGFCDTSQNPPACSQRQCLSDTDCTAPQKCDPNDSTCKDQPDNCDVNACQTQCAQQVDPMTGQPGTCNQATCSCGGSSPGGGMGMCTTDADCAQGQACALGICTDQATAPGGGACDILTCTFGGCVSAADGHTCDGTVCGITALMGLLGGGGGGGGASCSSDADCNTTAGETCQGGLPPLLPGTCAAPGGGGGVPCF